MKRWQSCAFYYGSNTEWIQPESVIFYEQQARHLSYRHGYDIINPAVTSHAACWRHSVVTSQGAQWPYLHGEFTLMATCFIIYSAERKVNSARISESSSSRSSSRIVALVWHHPTLYALQLFVDVVPLLIFHSAMFIVSSERYDSL